MTNQISRPDFLDRTGAIIAAYVTRNPVSTTELPILIRQVHESLTTVATGVEYVAPAPIETPTAPLKMSYTADAITCLECGARFKTLKRHLTSDHGLRPDQYRAKWNLPNEYPMVSPAYSLRRSQINMEVRLGRPSGGSERLK